MIFFVFSFSSLFSLFLFSHGFLMRCFVELALRQFKSSVPALTKHHIAVATAVGCEGELTIRHACLWAIL